MKAHTNKCCSDTETPCNDVLVDIQAKLTNFKAHGSNIPTMHFSTGIPGNTPSKY